MNQVPNPLEIFILFCNKIGFTPYKFQLCDHDQNTIIMKEQGKVKQWVSIAIMCLDMVVSLTLFRNSLQIQVQNPRDYFRVSAYFSNAIKHILLYYALLLKNKTIHEAVQYCNQFWSQLNGTRTGTLILWFSYVLCITNFIIGILPAITGENMMSNDIPWTLGNIFGAHIFRGRYIFFLQGNFRVSTQEDIDAAHKSPISIVLGMIHITVYLFYSIATFLIETGIILVTLSHLGCVYLFEKGTIVKPVILDDAERGGNFATAYYQESSFYPTRVCRNDGYEKESNFKKIFGPYFKLTGLSKCLNEAFGGLLLFFILTWVLSNAAYADKIFTKPEWNKTLKYAYVLVEYLIIFFLSSNISARVNNFKAWITDEQLINKSFPFEEVQLILHQLDNHSIGLTGWGGWTLNFGLVFEIISQTLTFFLIVIQIHDPMKTT